MDSCVSMETGGGPTVTNLSVLGRKGERGSFSLSVHPPAVPSCAPGVALYLWVKLLLLSP